MHPLVVPKDAADDVCTRDLGPHPHLSQPWQKGEMQARCSLQRKT